MKLAKIALAGILAVSSTFALAQSGTGSGRAGPGEGSSNGAAVANGSAAGAPTPGTSTTGANTRGSTQNGTNPAESDKMGEPNTGGASGTSTSSIPGNNNH